MGAQIARRACKLILLGICFLIVRTDAILADQPLTSAWEEMEPGVWRTGQTPYSYALVAGEQCLLIGASSACDPLELPGKASQCSLVLLSHHHRDSCAGVGRFLKAGIKVRAPELSQAYLSPDGVKKYWDISLPSVAPGEFPPLFRRYWSDWSFLVHPIGFEGIDFTLADGEELEWQDWRLKVVFTPGHSKDHTAFTATQDKSKRTICFCADAICSPGKMWSPYTMEWHHQQDTGLLAAKDSLRKLGATQPAVLYPEHGPPIRAEVAAALQETSARLELAAKLKNFDYYTKEMVGKPPEVKFLAKEQVGSANPMGNTVPWSQLSPHLFLTGNTYALVSEEGPVLLMDPYAQNLVPRLEELKKEHGAGPVEVALISHAHNDHYTGIFALPDRKAFQVWTLDKVAAVVDHPLRQRAPYVDPRTPGVDRQLEHGEKIKWREYELVFLHLPGQTNYALGVLVTVDGKRCLFTGDNFYHMDQYSGSGGWSGRNSGLPGGYAASAQLVLDLKPDWILAEHGGAFEFNQADFERRRDWAQKAAAAADALSPHGKHTYDWDPQRIRSKPCIKVCQTGRLVQVSLVAENPLSSPETYSFRQVLGGKAEDILLSDLRFQKPGLGVQDWKLRLRAEIPLGRNIVCLEVRNQAGELDPADVFLVLEVKAE